MDTTENKKDLQDKAISLEEADKVVGAIKLERFIDTKITATLDSNLCPQCGGQLGTHKKVYYYCLTCRREFVRAGDFWYENIDERKFSYLTAAVKNRFGL